MILEAVDFHAPSRVGCFLLLIARVTFTFKRVIDVEVIAIEENPMDSIYLYV